MNTLSILDFPENIQQWFKNVEMMDIDKAEIKIIENYEKDLIPEEVYTEALFILEKGKKKPIGAAVLLKYPVLTNSRQSKK